MDDCELTEYLCDRSNSLTSDFLRICLHDPREALFITRFARTVKKDNRIRSDLEMNGLHVPVFLISSITTSCNLFCKGCYARSEHICGTAIRPEMSLEDWNSVFDQAEELGIPFNILAGGEPMMRYDVIEKAAEHRNTVFPIFTNGTVLDDRYIDMFYNNRNLIPIFSLEGDREHTDDRRGAGTYDTVIRGMKAMKEKGLLYGVSLTVTKENQEELLSEDYLSEIESYGCKAVFLIEFVATDCKMSYLAPDSISRGSFDKDLARARKTHGNMMIMSFPGDERKMGGCIGAGRGFFRINPYGDAEACPASPHSDTNVMKKGLEGALRSRLFREIRSDRLLSEEHDGGCSLLKNEDRVLKILEE